MGLDAMRCGNEALPPPLIPFPLLKPSSFASLLTTTTRMSQLRAATHVRASTAAAHAHAAKHASCTRAAGRHLPRNVASRSQRRADRVVSPAATTLGEALPEGYDKLGKKPDDGRCAGVILHPTSLEGTHAFVLGAQTAHPQPRDERLLHIGSTT